MEEVYKRLTEYILDWNTKINVTAIRDPEEFYEKNIRDSLAVMELPEFAEAYRILDLGTGGGFPGLPLAIANPDKSFFLLDSVAKNSDKTLNELIEKILTDYLVRLHKFFWR